MKHLKPIIYAIVLVLALSCHRKSKKGGTPPPIKVEVTTALSKPIYDNIEVVTQIKSLYDTEIIARVGGFLRGVNYSDGMPIKRGELLFEIDPSQYNYTLLAAQAEVESATAQEILARNNYHRAVPLAAIDAISRSELDQYSATHSAAKAAVKSANEGLNNAELNVGYTKIYAPMDGIVADTPYTVGEYISALTSLTTISYVDTVTLDIPIPTTIYFQNAKGNSFDNSKLLSNITLQLSGGVPYEYKGTYYYTLKDSPKASSTVVIVAKFANPNRQLKSGMFARIKAHIGEPKERVLVPQIAVSQSQGVNSVWVMKGDSTVHFIPVTLGAATSEGWIVESGLKSGDKVLTSGQLKVHNGAKVSPTNR